MKQWLEFSLPELGYFTESECMAIREKAEGTYMNIKVSWSRYRGNNCMLILSTDYFDETDDYEESRNATTFMFMHRAIAALKQ